MLLTICRIEINKLGMKTPVDLMGHVNCWHALEKGLEP